MCVFLIDLPPYKTVNKCSAPKSRAAVKECFFFLFLRFQSNHCSAVMYFNPSAWYLRHRTSICSDMNFPCFFFFNSLCVFIILMHDRRLWYLTFLQQWLWKLPSKEWCCAVWQEVANTAMEDPALPIVRDCSKCWYLCSRLHNITSQSIIISGRKLVFTF